MSDIGDVKVPDAIKKLLRSEYLRKIGNTSLIDHYEIELFNWYYHESENQLRKMISSEHEYIKEQVKIGEEEINDSGMIAVEYNLKRSRFAHTIYLVSLVESLLGNSCTILSQIIGANNLPFKVAELKGDQWSVKKKYLERYGDFSITSGLWSEIMVLIKIRNNIVHDNGQVSELNQQEISMFKKHEGISLDAAEVVIEPKFIESSINNIRKLADSIESNLKTLSERAIKPQPV